jgi:hypothetical protein
LNGRELRRICSNLVLVELLGFGAYRASHEISSYGRAASKEKHPCVSWFVTFQLYYEPKVVKAALEKVLPFLNIHLLQL